MSYLKTIAVSAAVAGSLGLAALGIGSGVANAAPSHVVAATDWAQYRGWGHGPGHGWGGGPDYRGGGPGWGYGGPGYGYGGYGGYDAPPPCATGPLGLVRVCP